MITPDALTTAGSVVVSGNRLFNANPGSGTISMFEISPSDPTHLKLIGKPAKSGGDFPASVAVSSKTGNGGCTFYHCQQLLTTASSLCP